MLLSNSRPSGPLSEMSRITMSGLLLRDRLHRRLRLLGLAANLHILLLVDEQRESLAQKRMIVDDKHRLLGGCVAVLSRTRLRRHWLVPLLQRRPWGTCTVTRCSARRIPA